MTSKGQVIIDNKAALRVSFDVNWNGYLVLKENGDTQCQNGLYGDDDDDDNGL